jgi:hypothetical protein
MIRLGPVLALEVATAAAITPSLPAALDSTPSGWALEETELEGLAQDRIPKLTVAKRIRIRMVAPTFEAMVRCKLQK